MKDEPVLKVKSKDSNKSSMRMNKDNWIQQELSQLKHLNKKLIDEQWRLEDEINLIKQKERVQTLILESYPLGTQSHGIIP